MAVTKYSLHCSYTAFRLLAIPRGCCLIPWPHSGNTDCATVVADDVKLLPCSLGLLAAMDLISTSCDFLSSSKKIKEAARSLYLNSGKLSLLCCSVNYILVEVLWSSVFVDNSKNAWMFSSLAQQNQVRASFLMQVCPLTVTYEPFNNETNRLRTLLTQWRLHKMSRSLWWRLCVLL